MYIRISLISISYLLL